MIQQSKERMKEKDEEHKMFNEKPDEPKQKSDGEKNTKVYAR